MAEYVVAGQPLAIDGHAHQGGALGWAQAFASGHTFRLSRKPRFVQRDRGGAVSFSEGDCTNVRTPVHGTGRSLGEELVAGRIFRTHVVTHHLAFIARRFRESQPLRLGQLFSGRHKCPF